MKRDSENQLPRVRSVCEHGLPKLIPAERWLRLGESETARKDPAVLGGLGIIKGQLCVLYFAAGVYRAMPWVNIANGAARKRFEALFTEAERTALADLLRRCEAGEWREKAEAAWAAHQRESSMVWGF